MIVPEVEGAGFSAGGGASRAPTLRGTGLSGGRVALLGGVILGAGVADSRGGHGFSGAGAVFSEGRSCAAASLGRSLAAVGLLGSLAAVGLLGSLAAAILVAGGGARLLASWTGSSGGSGSTLTVASTGATGTTVTAGAAAASGCVLAGAGALASVGLAVFCASGLARGHNIHTPIAASTTASTPIVILTARGGPLDTGASSQSSASAAAARRALERPEAALATSARSPSSYGAASPAWNHFCDDETMLARSAVGCALTVGTWLIDTGSGSGSASGGSGCGPVGGAGAAGGGAGSDRPLEGSISVCPNLGGSGSGMVSRNGGSVG